MTAYWDDDRWTVERDDRRPCPGCGRYGDWTLTGHVVNGQLTVRCENGSADHLVRRAR